MTSVHVVPLKVPRLSPTTAVVSGVIDTSVAVTVPGLATEKVYTCEVAPEPGPSVPVNVSVNVVGVVVDGEVVLLLPLQPAVTSTAKTTTQRRTRCMNAP